MKKAFTLVELVILLVVLSVGLVTLLLVLRSASINNANAHFATVAGGLLDAKMEEVLADRAEEGFAYIENSNYPQETFDNYTIAVDIYSVDLDDLDTTASGRDYRRVEITVQKSGIEGQASLHTLVSDY